MGTALAGNEDGVIEFSLKAPGANPGLSAAKFPLEKTSACLKRKLENALECYHSIPFVWVPRDISDHPETSNGSAVRRESCESIVDVEGDIIIKALPQFGLTSMGRFIAYDNWLKEPGSYTAFIDASLTKPHEQAAIDAVKQSAFSDEVDIEILKYTIVDN